MSASHGRMILCRSCLQTVCAAGRAELYCPGRQTRVVTGRWRGGQANRPAAHRVGTWLEVMSCGDGSPEILQHACISILFAEAYECFK